MNTGDEIWFMMGFVLSNFDNTLLHFYLILTPCITLSAIKKYFHLQIYP